MTEIDSDQLEESLSSDNTLFFNDKPILDQDCYEVVEFTEKHKSVLIKLLNSFIPEVESLNSFDDKLNLYWRLGTLVDFFTDIFQIFLLYPLTVPNPNPVPPTIQQMSWAKAKKINNWIQIWLRLFYDSPDIINSLNIEDGSEMATMMILNIFFKIRASIPQIRSILETQWSSLIEFETRLTSHLSFEKLTSILLFQLENERVKHQMVEKQLKMEVNRLKDRVTEISRTPIVRTAIPMKNSQSLILKNPDSKSPKSLIQKSLIQKDPSVQVTADIKPFPKVYQKTSEFTEQKAQKVCEQKQTTAKIISKALDQKTTQVKSAKKESKSLIQKNGTLKSESKQSSPARKSEIKSEPASPVPPSPAVSVKDEESDEDEEEEEETSAFIQSLKNLPKKRGRPKRTFFEDDCGEEPPAKKARTTKTAKKATSQPTEPEPKEIKKRRKQSPPSASSSSCCSPTSETKSLIKKEVRILKQPVLQLDEANIHTVNYYIEANQSEMFYLETNYDMLKCRICSQFFATLDEFNSHIKDHESIRVFHCPWANCKRYFMTNYKLQRHARCHTGERPFKCDYCGKAFTRSDKLKDHIKVHLKTYPPTNKAASSSYSLVENSPAKPNDFVIKLKKITKKKSSSDSSPASPESPASENEMIIREAPAIENYDDDETPVETANEENEDVILIDC